MADSDFWRDLASQFQALHDLHGALRYDWYYIIGSSVAGQWNFAGSASGSIRTHFEALAARGASPIADGRPTDLLIAWLEALRRDGSGFLFGSRFIEQNADGSKTIHQTGSIFDVCEASANFCRTLELRALQAEFEERHPAITLIPAKQAPTPQAKAGPSSPREHIDRFILAMAKSGTKIKRKDIWRVAGYKDPTEFERFQRGDDRNQAAVSTFNRILRMEPEDFLKLLKQKRS